MRFLARTQLFRGSGYGSTIDGLYLIISTEIEGTKEEFDVQEIFLGKVVTYFRDDYHTKMKSPTNRCLY